MDSSDLAKSYDAYYFAHSCGRPYQRDEEWLRFFSSAAQRIVRDIHPRTVLDAGCAMGLLVEALRDLGVEAVGVDISEYAIQKVRTDIKPHCWVGSLVDPLPGNYDLIVSIEVFEHLSLQECDLAVENLCKHTDDILFSSTPFDYQEATHLNVRPPEYWAELFARHGFFNDVDFDSSFLTPWSRRFCRTRQSFPRVVAGFERRLWQLEQENHARRSLTVEQRNELAKKQREIDLLSNELAEKGPAKQNKIETSLTEREEKEQTKALSDRLLENPEGIEPINFSLSEQLKQVRQLLAQFDERHRDSGTFSAQVAEHYDNIQNLMSRLAEGQRSVESSVAEALERDDMLSLLTSQAEELRAEQTNTRRELAEIRAESADKDVTLQTLKSESDEKDRTIDSLSIRLAELRLEIISSQQKQEAMIAESGEKDAIAQTLRSQIADKEKTIGSLSMRLTEQMRAVKSLSLQLADKAAQLTKITHSMGWKLLSLYGRRIKYPYLLPLYRLYGKIKYPYLLPIYRWLGLIPGDRTERPVELGPPSQFSSQAVVVPQQRFPVTRIQPPVPLQAHRASVDVIVCVHNALDDVKRCLQSVVRYTRMPYALTIVDDGSQEETRDYLTGFATSQGVTLIQNEKARGYTFAANEGLRHSLADYVLLLNSDTVVTPDWLDRMVECGEADARIGIVSPLSNAASWQSIPEFIRNDEFVENKLPDDSAIVNMSRLVSEYSARLYPRIPFLNGFCLMIKRAVITQVGYFDEETFGEGYGEENDYCLRAAKMGWQMAVADDSYVYHSQSRSYSHERRKQLTARSDEVLAAKHDRQIIMNGVLACRYDRVLDGVRARSRVAVMRKQFIEEGRLRWEGNRVLFILPILDPAGGANVILQEAKAMQSMGVDVRILTLTNRRAAFERIHPDNSLPLIDVGDELRIPELFPNYDAVVAAMSGTVDWLNPPTPSAKLPVRGYYVQDFEPYFFPKNSEAYKVSLKSYSRYSDLVRVTKTEWNRNVLMKEIGVECSVVGASVDIDLFRPRRRLDADSANRPLRIAAMIRPSTPRRNPKLTMEVLKEIHKAHGENVEIILFGSQTDDPGFQALPRDFGWRNAGVLTRSELAFLLNEIEIFVDFSEFQAMGLTALEAMACGVAVIVPQKGGTSSFARLDENSIIVNTESRQASISALERLIMDENLRNHIQRQALIDSCQYFPERPAYNILAALFPGDDSLRAT